MRRKLCIAKCVIRISRLTHSNRELQVSPDLLRPPDVSTFSCLTDWRRRRRRMEIINEPIIRKKEQKKIRKIFSSDSSVLRRRRRRCRLGNCEFRRCYHEAARNVPQQCMLSPHDIALRCEYLLTISSQHFDPGRRRFTAPLRILWQWENWRKVRKKSEHFGPARYW